MEGQSPIATYDKGCSLSYGDSGYIFRSFLALDELSGANRKEKILDYEDLVKNYVVSSQKI